MQPIRKQLLVWSSGQTKSLVLDPATEGTDHVNIYKDSRTNVGRFLYPGTPSIPIDSALGFNYTTLIAPIKYLKFERREVFEELTNASKKDAEKIYNKYLNVEKKKPVRHFRSIMLYLLWERAVLDVEYRDHLLALGDFKLYSYELESKKINNAHVLEAKTTTFNIWLPSNLREVRKAIISGEPIDTNINRNSKHKDVPWYYGVPTMETDEDLERKDIAHTKLCELAKKIVV